MLLRFRQYLIFFALAVWLTPQSLALAEVHYFCTIMAGTQCGHLRQSNLEILEEISQKLPDNAPAQTAIGAVRRSVADGTMTGLDFATLANTIRAATIPSRRADVDATLAELAVNQQVQIWLTQGVPGNTVVPQGNDVVIALVPGLPLGQIIPLGFGPVLIGVDQGADAVVLGQGNVANIAAQVSRGGAGGEVTLANPTDADVNYTVNRQSYSMAPTFEQNLGAGNWLISFDRGGDKGTAEYQLAAGYYEFTVTDDGWELYKKRRPAPQVATASSASPPLPQPSVYVERAGIELPKGFRLFDPIQATAGSDEPPALATLPENFTLFREAAPKLAKN